MRRNNQDFRNIGQINKSKLNGKPKWPSVDLEKNPGFTRIAAKYIKPQKP